MFAFPLQENNVRRLKPGNWGGGGGSDVFCALILNWESLQGQFLSVCGFSICSFLALGFALYWGFLCCFPHLIFIRAFQRRWLSPCLSYRLGAEEVGGLVSSVERLQVAQLEFKPGSRVLPSAATSSDFRIWTQNSQSTAFDLEFLELPLIAP